MSTWEIQKQIQENIYSMKNVDDVYDALRQLRLNHIKDLGLNAINVTELKRISERIVNENFHPISLFGYLKSVAKSMREREEKLSEELYKKYPSKFDWEKADREFEEYKKSKQAS